VNGKLRATFEIDRDAGKEAVEQKALGLEETKRALGGKVPKKVIVVPGRIVNIVL